MKKELSVLIVAHNEENIIRTCLSRLDFADEIVIILDNCTDATEDICKSFTDKIYHLGRLRVIEEILHLNAPLNGF